MATPRDATPDRISTSWRSSDEAGDDPPGDVTVEGVERGAHIGRLDVGVAVDEPVDVGRHLVANSLHRRPQPPGEIVLHRRLEVGVARRSRAWSRSARRWPCRHARRRRTRRPCRTRRAAARRAAISARRRSVGVRISDRSRSRCSKSMRSPYSDEFDGLRFTHACTAWYICSSRCERSREWIARRSRLRRRRIER